MWDLIVEQHSTWNGSALSHLYGDCPASFQAINQENVQNNCTSCLTLPLPSKWIYFIFIFVITLMSVCHSLRSCSSLKTVFGKIGDIYQAYCHTYKTHAMATCHGGSGQPSDRDVNTHKVTDTEIEHAEEFHHGDTNDFEESDPNNPTRLTILTRELDDLC